MNKSQRRALRYPDTATFHYHNANVKDKITGDCVVRAIATALDQSWEQTVRELTEVGIKYGYLLDEKACYSRYLESKGWHKHPQPRKDDGTKYTGAEFCIEFPKYAKRCVANIGSLHVVAIMYGQVWDIWNSERRYIGNFWYHD